VVAVIAVMVGVGEVVEIDVELCSRRCRRLQGG
jgi:hypothetical protein